MKKLSLSLFLMLFGYTANAQFWSAGGHFNGGFAQGKLKDETNGLFIPTISGIFLHEAQTFPIQVGFELGYGIYGSKLEKRTDYYQGFNDELRLRRNNNILTGMAVMRYQTNPLGNIRHFMEAKFGANYLYTRFKIRDSIVSDEVIESGKDFENWTLSYSVGTGVQIPLNSSGLFLELKGNYQTGNSVRFLTKGDATYKAEPGGGGKFDYNYRRSPLDLLMFSVGLIHIGI
ncbi:hypothetical protein SAMN03080617_03563 [Algoriphagus alkaliphilus]|uniref:Outer membrane protein beta-barrel domain-containing protein n=1 Tax=Algoriphagus alkaliphilus TaxID=279824 RepID=A0A1G5ZBP6_9BACT|nr:hypothetical protein [Algoriphagus alkaliphilus]MBA4299065.1 hypothetical protein [Cyclobacterium sp.]SDA92369.1 hypothetical protein SAMN03080617_03563 [Algoriphagus alkaliphilus]